MLCVGKREVGGDARCGPGREGSGMWQEKGGSGPRVGRRTKCKTSPLGTRPDRYTSEDRRLGIIGTCPWFMRLCEARSSKPRAGRYTVYRIRSVSEAQLAGQNRKSESQEELVRGCDETLEGRRGSLRSLHT